MLQPPGVLPCERILNPYGIGSTLCEELFTLAERDPYVVVTRLRSCVGSRLNYLFRALSLHSSTHLAESSDRLTLNTVQRLVRGFALQHSSSPGECKWRSRCLYPVSRPHVSTYAYGGSGFLLWIEYLARGIGGCLDECDLGASSFW